MHLLPAILRFASFVIPLCLLFASHAAGDVVVLNNRTSINQTFEVATKEAGEFLLEIAPRESRPVFSDAPVAVSYSSRRGRQTQQLSLNAVYYTSADENQGLQLRRIDLGEGNKPPATRDWPQPIADFQGKGLIPVLVCVDDEEPTREEVWQTRLRRRVERASAVLASHTGLSLRIVAYSRWQSANEATSIEQSIAEFEKSVRPAKGVLALGFTSQYHIVSRRRHMGGTRGPLRSHLLVREWSTNLGEQERLEILLHELGHYLGATHSPEPYSVMRPLLSNQFTRLKSHTTLFDAANTLAMATLAEERHRRSAASLNECSPLALQRLGQIYKTVGQSIPDDPGAAILARRLGGAGLMDKSASSVYTTEALTMRARQIAQQLTSKPTGDELTNDLVRAASKAAATEPSRTQRVEFLISLGLAFDNTDCLINHPRTNAQADKIDPPNVRASRRRAMGRATARGREDTVKHFFACAALAAASSPAEALLWGNCKECFDAQGGSGCSFADLAANAAGVRFAEGVLNGSLPIRVLAQQFNINHFVPSLDGLPEGLQSAEFINEYGGPGDPRYEKVMQEIRSRIDQLPPYLRLGID